MSNTTNLSKRGFTLVELLIVIVVIAILAAISIVAYNGVQNRGKAAAAQSLASQVAKKAEAWNTIEGDYPTYAEFVNNEGDNDPGEPDAAKLDDSGVVQDNTFELNAGSQDNVIYEVCSDTVNTIGFIITYYDAVEGTSQTISGGQSTGSTDNGAVTCA